MLSLACIVTVLVAYLRVFISGMYASVHGDKLDAVSIGTVCPRSTDLSCASVADPPDSALYTVSLGTRGVVDQQSDHVITVLKDLYGSWP